MLDTVRARLTLWYVAVLGAVLLTFSGAVYALLARALHSRVDAALEALIDVAAVSLTHDAAEGQSPQDAANSTVAELSTRQQALAIYDSHLEPLAVRPIDDDVSSPAPPRDRPILDRRARFSTVEGGKRRRHPIRTAVRRVEIQPAGTTYIVLGSQSLEAVQDELASLRRILLWSVPIALGLAAIGGWTLARRSLSPVVSMADQARRIGAASLDQRLAVSNPRDELGRLALAFNELLDRLSRSFDQQRQFMADASHELRTPLMAIRSAADVTLQREQREEDEYRAALALVARQGRRLGRIVDDMFTLSRADTGHAPLRKQTFYLDELLAEIAHAGSQIGSARRVAVTVDAFGETPFYGDEELLRRMLTNLVDNAIRYSPADETVTVSLARDERHYRISIRDRGPGVPSAAQPHIFDRFYRADAARTFDRSDGGAGLGLAISRWIAEAHGGSIRLEDSSERGSTFVAVLPASEPPPAPDKLGGSV